ncbi:hypothetical protein [Marinicella meishanensis]|uniref:hypothetical protein n=1 Tax=Marinicella meishanensis TaxID=2873263 RepID=UPI001CBF84F2|nr:hypothetical protein [Marinicella sp. NBU2979]
MERQVTINGKKVTRYYFSTMIIVPASFSRSFNTSFKKGSVVYGYNHSHPANSISNQEKFSPDDIEFTQNASGKPYFLRTPSGAVRELSYDVAIKPRVGKNSKRYIAGKNLCHSFDCSGLED